MSKQENNKDMKVRGDEGKEKNEKRQRREATYIDLPYWLLERASRYNRKTDKDKLTFEDVAVYQLIYHLNAAAPNKIFAKNSQGELAKHIAKLLFLNDGTVENSCFKRLKMAEWIERKDGLRPFGDSKKKQMGFLCIVSNEGKKAARQGKQLAMQELEDQRTEPVVVESSARGRADYGEMYLYGRRFYIGEDGKEHYVPKLAPPRPTATAVWDNDTEAWYEPEDLPEIRSEF